MRRCRAFVVPFISKGNAVVALEHAFQDRTYRSKIAGNGLAWLVTNSAVGKPAVSKQQLRKSSVRIETFSGH